MDLALGTLAAATVLSGNLWTESSDFYVVSAELYVGLRGHTGNEGPILVGLAHGDLTDAEIEESIEAVTSAQLSDRIQRERATRPVRDIGMFPGNAADEMINDGNPVKTPIRWMNRQGDDMKAWAFNSDGSALTTGTVFNLEGKIFVRPA